ncbi:TrbC/VirB2 family protein [Providencia alcalifaciens]|uniref:TrbC/VirB2 family protein n=1 Tax=Providencia alcalifaciens TaxID=126385 RepID=UPI0024AA91AA|nr:TrbC/VirB2 family protein [Providencia rettgeri]HEM7189739.1 TrbC/VirB2 family protein [Providencia rettgeri]
MFVVSSMLIVPDNAYAAGLQKANDVLQIVVDILSGIAILGGTIAILWAGYRVTFGGQPFREAAPVLIGGIVVGGAGTLAAMLYS